MRLHLRCAPGDKIGMAALMDLETLQVPRPSLSETVGAAMLVLQRRHSDRDHRHDGHGCRHAIATCICRPVDLEAP